MIRLARLVTCLAAAGFALAQLPASGSDESAIRELVQRYMGARNTRDAQATRSLFTQDADQVVSTGEWRKGLDGMVASMMAASQKENGKSAITLESIRLLDRDVAIADGRYETIEPQSGAARKMWTTLILKRTDAGWRIAAIRNMLPSQPAAH